MSEYTELKRLAEVAVQAIGHWGRRDSFERQLAKLATPEAVLALIAENERLESEAVYSAAGFDAAHEEIARLKAEVAGLRTGYEAYERVNAELKAESEALRNALRPLLANWDDLKPGESINVDAARAAMGEGEQS